MTYKFKYYCSDKICHSCVLLLYTYLHCICNVLICTLYGFYYYLKTNFLKLGKLPTDHVLGGVVDGWLQYLQKYFCVIFMIKKYTITM